VRYPSGILSGATVSVLLASETAEDHAIMAEASTALIDPVITSNPD
jgi:hypothetical protein